MAIYAQSLANLPLSCGSYPKNTHVISNSKPALSDKLKKSPVRQGRLWFKTLYELIRLNSRGLEYTITAEDKTGDSAQISQDVIITLPEPGITSMWLTSSGNDQNRYKIISFPLKLDKSKVSDVLVDDLGKYDREKWRFYGYSDKLIEYSSKMEIQNGLGYWIIVGAGNKKIDTGRGKTYPISKVYPIKLNKGYSLIGNPFAFSIPKTHISLENTKSKPNLLTYSAGWLALGDSLKPFEGFAVYDTSSTSIIIDPRSAQIPPNGRSDMIDWSIQISARSGKVLDSFNFATASSEALTGCDLMDYPEPPVLGDFVSIYFPHLEWNQPSGKFCIDARPSITGSEEWTFEVISNTREGIELEFLGIDQVPDNLNVYLVDTSLSILHDLRKDNHYEASSDNEDKPRKFRLLVGEAQLINEQTSTIGAASTTFALDQNYPNPFNTSTRISFEIPRPDNLTISIFDIKGHNVRVLAEDTPYEAGRHTLSWDGQSSSGLAVASGTYFVEIRVNNWRELKKMLLIR